MSLDSTTLVPQVLQLHADAVERWHTSHADNPYTGLLSVVCQQHRYNYELWHQEDIARCPDATDEQIAAVKRKIDGLNQQRNDWIERIDETLLDMMAAACAQPPASAPLNTETPGSAIDRLSIMSLRVYHLQEELDREGVDEAHQQKVNQRLSRCAAQTADLSNALRELLSDIFAGRKRLRVYRQMKMYNDPSLNPYLYKATRKAG